VVTLDVPGFVGHSLGGAIATTLAEALITVGEGRLAGLLAQAELPLAVIWGRRDRTVPSRHVRAVRRVRPDAEVELIDRAVTCR
jgi:pimeloyl-ACP methyl ester carboxylesterase